MLKKVALLLCTALCVTSLTGCGGSKKETDGIKYYSLEEINLSFGVDEYPSNPMLVGNDLYYVTTVYPDYPHKYYDDMAMLDQKLGGTDSGISDDSNIEDTPVVTEEPAKDDSEEGKDKATTEPSDDDLIGDMDDVFGDDKPENIAEPAVTDAPEGDAAPADDAEAVDDAVVDDAVSDGSTEDNAKTYDGDPSKGDPGINTYDDLNKKYSDYKTKMILWKYNMEKQKSDSVLETEMENGNIDGMNIEDDGSITLVERLYEYDMATSESKTEVELVNYGTDGTEKSKTSLNDQFKDFDSDTFCINNVIFDKDGGMIVSYGEKSICKLDKNGKSEWDITADNYLDGIVIDRNSDIIISYYNDDGGAIFAKVDCNKKAVGDPIKGISDDKKSSYSMLSGNPDYDLLLKDGNSLFSYDEKTSTKAEMLKWIDCGLVGNMVDKIFPLKDGGFVCSYSDSDGNSKFGILKESENQSVAASKQVITMASAYVDSMAQQKIIEFNKKSDKYKIECKNYENEDDPSAKLASDIVAGNIPDIIDVSGVDINNFAAKGIFEDLSSYMEKDDKIKDNYFVDGLLDATKIDGKQYFLMKYFNIITLAGKASELGKYKDGWTVKDVIDYYNSKPKGTQLLEGDCKDNVFNTLFSNEINSYINWETGEVSFNGEAFKNMLDFCNGFPQEYNYDDAQDTHTLIKDNKLLLSAAYIGSTEEIQVYKGLFNNDVEYVGYPTSDGYGSYISPNMSYAISSSSKHKDAAWEFIKSIMTSEDATNDHMGMMPVSSAAFEEMVKRDSTKESYTDDLGNKVEPRTSSYGYGDYEVNIGPATDDEIQTLRDLIKKSSGVLINSNSAMTMITEEVDKFFAGDKKLEEIVDVLQDKMVKYVNENK